MTRPMSAAILALAALVLTSSAVSAQAPPVPALPGIAAGTVTVGSTTITLAHAYVGALADGLYEVVLTDAPVPPADIAVEVKSGGGQRLLRSGKVNGISMLVDGQGFLRNIIPFVGELRGGSMLSSAGTLTAFAASAAGVTGRGNMTAAQTMGQGWSVAASWNAVPVAVK